MPFQKTILCYNSKGREIIVKAYHDYPNDYRIMHYYMWNIGGDMADNNPTVLIEHKEEFLFRKTRSGTNAIIPYCLQSPDR